MPNDAYGRATAAIRAARLTPTQRYRAGLLLDLAARHGGCLSIGKLEARDLFEVESDSAVRRVLGCLQAAGLLSYGAVPSGYCWRF